MSIRDVRSQRTLAFMVAGLATVLTPAIAQNDPANPQAPAAAVQEEPLKTFDQMPVPTVADLLTKPPVDWVVLKPPRTNEVLVVQPVSPRADTLLKLKKQLEDLKSATRRPKQEQGESADQYRDRLRQLIEESENLIVFLPLDPKRPDITEGTEYKLNIDRHIDRIVFHEDLMLKRADLLMNDGQLGQAYELLLVLERRFSDWPGYSDRRNRLVFEEAKVLVQSGSLEAAYAYLEELHTVAPNYPRLRDELGNTCDALISGAEQQGDLMQARFYLSRLRKREPQHPVTLKWTDHFVKRVDDLITRARTAREQGQLREAIAFVDEGTRVWPSHPQLRNIHRAIANRYQILTVGVTRFSKDSSPFPLQTRDDRRLESLLAVDLFEIGSFDRYSRYQSRYFEEWTPTDLGRQIVFSLRPRRATWEPGPLLSASQVVQALGERLTPESAYFDERLSNYVRTLSVRSPFEFAVNLSTIPVRPQAILRFPVRSRELESAATGTTGQAPLMDNILSRRFQIVERAEDRIVFQRSIPEPDTSSQFHVAEVVERKYPSTEGAIQGLLRGDVSVFPYPPIWLVDRIAAGDQFQVEPFAIPTTHLLQFNPASEPFRNSEFRRAIAYSINRARILNDIVFREESSNRGRLITGPFPTKSYAYDPAVEQQPFDIALAFALVSVAKKRLGGSVPELTMICEPDEVMLRCAQEFVKEWARIGIPVKLVTEPQEQPPAQWDLVYRTVQVAEPAVELWPLLTLQPGARVRDLEHLPDWLRQQLIELEQAIDFKTGGEILRRLHFRLQESAQIVPLWEIDDVLVIRKNIQGFPASPVGPYHNVERWIIQPWYPSDIGDAT